MAMHRHVRAALASLLLLLLAARRVLAIVYPESVHGHMHMQVTRRAGRS